MIVPKDDIPSDERGSYKPAPPTEKQLAEWDRKDRIEKIVLYSILAVWLLGAVVVLATAPIWLINYVAFTIVVLLVVTICSI